MKINLTELNRLNILEIEMLKSILGVQYDSKKQVFNLSSSLSTNQLIKIYFELKNTIWTKNNIELVLKELEQPPSVTRVHYFGNGRPMSLDTYLSKMGLLENEILVEDQLCFPLPMKPDFSDHILKNPSIYIKHMFEHAMSMIYVEEWVKKGYVYFVPSLPLIDIKSFWELGELSKKTASETNWEQTQGASNALRYSVAEGSLNLMVEISRLTQNHYGVDHIKKALPDMSDKQAQDFLKHLQNQTLEDREETVTKWALSKHKLSEDEKISILSQYERQRPFNIERYLDVSKLDNNFIPTASMPLFQSTYLAEKFNCIPSTDNLGLMYGYEGWCQALKQNLKPEFELVDAKVNMPFSFLNDLPVSFIQKSRESGISHTASKYLDDEWKKIRTTQDIGDYKKAVSDFGKKIKADYSELESENEKILDNLVLDISKTSFKGLGAFTTSIMVTEMPIAIASTLSTLMIGAIDTVKTFRKSKNELQVKPLAVFLEARKQSKHKLDN